MDLPTDRNYIIGYHPHGIISVGAFVNFGTNSTGFPKLFPGIDLRLCTLAPNFKVPFLSTFLLSLGLISANRGAITSVVKRKKMADGTYAKGTGKAAMIVVGGAEEALYAVSLGLSKGVLRFPLSIWAHLLTCSHRNLARRRLFSASGLDLSSLPSKTAPVLWWVFKPGKER